MPFNSQAYGKKTLSPAYLVFIWFGSAVLLGTILLWLPWSHVSRDAGLPFVDALFTSVSAACVTGLSVVNVGETYSFFGQFVIFALMEIGGLGIMSFANLGFRLLGLRLSMTHQAATADSFYQHDAADVFRKTFMQILKVTLLVQAAGAVGMAVSLAPDHWHRGERLFMLWSAAFHSVSAFCNSGFTLYPDGLRPVSGNIPFLAILLILAALGGLGHIVLNELYRLPGYIRHHVKKPHWISLHTRVVLSMTALLIVFGVLGIWLFGTRRDGDSPLWDAIFETVSGRTAGFSLISQAALPLPSLIILMFLMFVGGSPGSCAGGIKTTSLAIWMARIKANLRNDSSVVMFGYTIAPELVSRARILMALTVMWNLLGVFVLAAAHPDESLQTLIFEQISAFGTVGLSMDFTPSLSAAARLWIIVSMFVGRLGPLTIALWVVPLSKAKINRPMGRVMVG